MCLARCTATCPRTAPGLEHDILPAVLPEGPGVTCKRTRTGNVSHSAPPMHHGTFSWAAIYKTCRAEELTLYETQIPKRLNSSQFKFSWLWSLLLSWGYTTLTLGSLPR